MYKGKQICNCLRAVRIKIAELNGIDYKPAECTHEGDCPGTCPVCEAEVKFLNDKLDEMEDQGVVVKRELELEGLDMLIDINGELYDSNMPIVDNSEGEDYLLGDIAVLPDSCDNPYDLGGIIPETDSDENEDSHNKITGLI